MALEAKIKGSDQVVQVTGKSGDYYRVFIKEGGNMYHDWYHKDSLVWTYKRP